MNIIIAFFVLVLIPQLSFAKVRCPSANVYSHYDKIILDASKKYHVDAALIHAVIKQESCYDRFAISPAGAEGLMQLMPATAKRFSVSNSFIAKQNISAGTRYLAWLLKRFKGNLRFALAGYNAGEGKVDRYKGIPPYKETRNYVKKVMANYYGFKGYSATKPSTKTVISSHKNKQKSVLKRRAIETKPRLKQPSGLAFNRKKQQPTATPIDNKRHRIRSITLAKTVTRNGYIRIRARIKQGDNNAS